MFPRHLLSMLFVMHAPVAAADEQLGRLFFTPEERATLGVRQPTGDTVPEDMLAINGIVSRSGGKSTVWINGRPHHDNAAGEDGLRAAVSTHRPHRAAVLSGRAGLMTLRAGETLDLRTGRRSDVVDADAVRIHTNHAQARP